MEEKEKLPVETVITLLPVMDDLINKYKGYQKRIKEFDAAKVKYLTLEDLKTQAKTTYKQIIALKSLGLRTSQNNEDIEEIN